MLFSAQNDLGEHFNKVSRLCRNLGGTELGVIPALHQHGLLQFAIPLIQAYIVMSVGDCDSSLDDQLLYLGVTGSERVIARIHVRGNE